jgi:hypothetical protein
MTILRKIVKNSKNPSRGNLTLIMKQTRKPIQEPSKQRSKARTKESKTRTKELIQEPKKQVKNQGINSRTKQQPRNK